VPALVVSPWTKAHATTSVLHDHTFVLAEIEKNLRRIVYTAAS
jgi:hypothetical protein